MTLNHDTTSVSPPVIPSTDGCGLEFDDVLHAEFCPCNLCHQYHVDRGWPRDTHCAGPDCQGCDLCPPLSESPAWRQAALRTKIEIEPYIWDGTTREMQPVAWYAGPPNPADPYSAAFLYNPPVELDDVPAATHGDGCFCADCEFARTQVEPEPAPIYYRQFPLGEWLARADDVAHWHLPILAPAGAISLLSGGPKSGKTMLYWGLLAELERNGTVLGDKALPGLRVTIWTEEGPQTLRHKATAVKMDTVADWNIVGVTDLENRDWGLMVDGAIDLWRQTEIPDLLIVDTIGDWAQSSDWNDYATTVAVLIPLRRLIAAFPHLAIVVIHHNRKAKGDAVDAASGSNALTGKVDNIVSLDKTDACDDYTRRLRFMGRIQPPDLDGVDLYVRFDPLTGHYSRERKGKKFEDAILDVIPDASDTITPKQIADVIGADDDGLKPSDRTIRSMLTRLHNAGVVERQGSGGRSDPYRYSMANY